MNPARSSLIKILMAAGPFFAWAANADLQPFPLSANQQGTVACLANPAVSYSVYLPPGYSTNGTPLPIIYTENPSGGGMVSTFKTACSNLNIIAIGLNGYNGMGWSRVVGDYYLISGDVRQRVLFDPTAVFIGGFSGGGEMSYVLSRADASHVAGILPMAGWLGRYPATVSISPYCSVDRVLTNLLAARTTGTTDASSYYLVPDSNYLAACGAVVKDWSFSGGHAAAPSSVITSCLQWLVSQRTPTQPNDRSNSIVQTADWRVRMAAGQSESVLRECVATLVNQPRTWSALGAQLVLDDLTTNYSAFQLLNVADLYPASSSLVTNKYATTNGNDAFIFNNYAVTNYVWVNYWSRSDFASDMFYYTALGAAANHEWPQYDCALKALPASRG